MIKLNLTPEYEEQERIKRYLEENVSDILADKINNGVFIVKDGKRFLNKKDLNTFWTYAISEAKKLQSKSSKGAIVDDDKVFSWAIHYFEENSIEGTLYNEDGSPIKIESTKPVKQSKTTEKAVKKAKKPYEMQFSLFDQLEENTPKETDIEEDDEEPTEEEIQDAFAELKQEEKPRISPVYQKYMEFQNRYPDCIIAYRLGDFYEIFGENAKLVADRLEMTLTGRDCGLPQRVPMIGIPYHAIDNYIAKIIRFGKIALVEPEGIVVKEKEKLYSNVDYDTGEVFDLSEEEMRKFDGDITEPSDETDDENDDFMETVKSIDKDIMLKLYDLLDGQLDVR